LRNAKKISERDFELLLSFLNEKNEGTVSLVKNQIRHALKIQPDFRNAIHKLSDPVIRTHAEMVVEESWFEEVQPAFRQLLRQGKHLDLEKGATLLATIAYPDLKISHVSARLNKMTEDLNRLLLKEYPLPIKPIQVLGQYLFRVQGFHGNEKNYYDPDNSFINKVLERKTGIPISLSLVYLLLAARLKLIAHGVGLPGHFIVGVRLPRGVVHIDPFNQGKILRKKDCEVLVKRMGFLFKEEHLDPVLPRQLLARMILNLINVYTEQGAVARAHWLTALFHLVQE